MNSENINAIKHLKEAMIEMNKKIKALSNHNDIEQIKADISALKSSTSNYVLIPDFREIKELSEENKKTISKMREELEDFINAQSENSDIVNIKRKLESVSNKVHDIVENVLNKKGDNMMININLSNLKFSKNSNHILLKNLIISMIILQILENY